MPSSPTEKINRLLALVREIKRRPTQKPESLYAKLGCSRSQFFVSLRRGGLTLPKHCQAAAPKRHQPLKRNTPST